MLVEEEWYHESWWHKLVHVCRRWRYLVLGSASYLGLGLLCTYDTPVEDMLAHAPPLPLIIDHIHPQADDDVSAEDEEGVLLALQHRDRVRRIRLRMPTSNLQKLIVAMDGEFPMLEYLHIRDATTRSEDTNLILPKTLRAPRLQLLMLQSIIYPMGSRLLTTTAGLVTLMLPLSTGLPPGDVLQWLSLLPRLEIFAFSIFSPTDSVAEGRLMDLQTMTQVTLPKLRRFVFEGTLVYLEALLPWITAPLLNGFQICFAERPTISIPCLQQFITTKEQLKYNCARLKFDTDLVSVGMYPPGWDDSEAEPFLVEVNCARFGPQVESIARVLAALGTAFSKVENLTLEYRCRGLSILETSPEELPRQRWRQIFRPFSNVKTLRFPNELVWVLSLSLHPEAGQSPMDLLPELKELSYSPDRIFKSLPGSLASDQLAAFTYARQGAGHPVTLVCRES
jgi:hypothetical protein